MKGMQKLKVVKILSPKGQNPYKKRQFCNSVAHLNATGLSEK